MSPPMETMRVMNWVCMGFLPLSLSLARVSNQDGIRNPERSQDAARVKRLAPSCAPHPGATVPVRERGF